MFITAFEAVAHCGNPKALVVGAVLAAFFALLIVAVNVLGKRLDKHDQWLATLDLRLDNLHEGRKRRDVQSLQIRPPPLSEARTVEVPEELLLTLKRDPKARKDGPR